MTWPPVPLSARLSELVGCRFAVTGRGPDGAETLAYVQVNRRLASKRLLVTISDTATRTPLPSIVSVTVPADLTLAEVLLSHADISAGVAALVPGLRWPMGANPVLRDRAHPVGQGGARPGPSRRSAPTTSSTGSATRLSSIRLTRRRSGSSSPCSPGRRARLRPTSWPRRWRMPSRPRGEAPRSWASTTFRRRPGRRRAERRARPAPRCRRERGRRGPPRQQRRPSCSPPLPCTTCQASTPTPLG